MQLLLHLYKLFSLLLFDFTDRLPHVMYIGPACTCNGALYSLLSALIEQFVHIGCCIIKQTPDEAFGLHTANYFVSCQRAAVCLLFSLPHFFLQTLSFHSV